MQTGPTPKSSPTSNAGVSRYHRQSILPQFPAGAQDRLASTSVLIVGCGALGCASAEQLVRAGVGRVAMVDRDVVEWTNLQRQSLFDENDARHGTSKAEAATARLRQINSGVIVQPLAIDLDAGNIESVMAEQLTGRFNLVLDGTDNAQSRYLLNDACVKRGIDFVYAGVLGVEGRVLGVRPGKTPCLRCVFPQPPDAGELDTCDTAGVLQAAVAMVASVQVTTAFRMIFDVFEPTLVRVNAWEMSVIATRAGEIDAACPCCQKRQFDFLNRPPQMSKLCGRNVVQVRTPNQQRLDLSVIARRMEKLGTVQTSGLMLKLVLDESPGLSMSIFADGRMLVFGTDSVSVAKSVMARVIGL